MFDLEKIRSKVIDGNLEEVVSLTTATLEAGTPADVILHEGLVKAMEIVGERFSTGEFFLPEMLMAGHAMKAALNLLRQELAKGCGRAYMGKVAIGTVAGDAHDIGKNIVIMMLEGSGWDVTDLGIDVSPEEFCRAVRENDFQVLGLSALLSSTMPSQEQTIKALRDAGLRDKVKVIIGGAPVTQSFADDIGADAYGKDAAEAVEKCRLLLKNDSGTGLQGR